METIKHVRLKKEQLRKEKGGAVRQAQQNQQELANMQDLLADLDKMVQDLSLTNLKTVNEEQLYVNLLFNHNLKNVIHTKKKKKRKGLAMATVAFSHFYKIPLVPKVSKFIFYNISSSLLALSSQKSFW